jgi:hypothetical protein
MSVSRVRLERGAGTGEPIHVWPNHARAAPLEFVWRGRRYRVRSLEAEAGERRSPHRGLRRFRVRTTDGLSCVLAQETIGGAWRIARLVSPGGGP